MVRIFSFLCTSLLIFLLFSCGKKEKEDQVVCYPLLGRFGLSEVEEDFEARRLLLRNKIAEREKEAGGRSSWTRGASSVAVDLEKDRDGKGEWVWRYDKTTGALLEVFQTENDVLEGIQAEYNNAGVAIYEGYYRKGNKIIFSSYYPDGTKRLSGGYCGTEKHGGWQYYYSNGHIREKQAYQRGVRDGIFEYYDRKGALIRKETYQNGNRLDFVDMKSEEDIEEFGVQEHDEEE